MEEDDDSIIFEGCFRTIGTFIHIVVSLIDLIDNVLDFIFAVSLMQRAASSETADFRYGVTLFVATVWSILIAFFGKTFGKRAKGSNAKIFTAVMTEILIYYVEDCTMVMVIAGVGSFDSSNFLDFATVVLSLVSAGMILFVGILVLYDWVPSLCKSWEGDEIYQVATFFSMVGSAGFFGYLLIRILIEGSLVSLGSGLHTVAWILYGFQIIIMIVGSSIAVESLRKPSHDEADDEKSTTMAASPVIVSGSPGATRSVKQVNEPEEHNHADSWMKHTGEIEC